MLDRAYSVGASAAEEVSLEKVAVSLRSLAATGMLGGIAGGLKSQLSERDDGSLWLDPRRTELSAVQSGALGALGGMGGLSLAGALGGGLAARGLAGGAGMFLAPTVVNHLTGKGAYS